MESQESSPTQQFKSINSSVLSFLYGPTLASIHDYWKNHSFEQIDFCWKSFSDSSFGKESTCNLGAAATAAKSLQSRPTLCDPIDGSPPGSTVPMILQARTLEWVAISFSNAWKWKVKVKLLSRVWVLVTLSSLPGSSIHGIFQARVLEWGAIVFSGNSGDPDSSSGSLSPGEGMATPSSILGLPFYQAWLVKNLPAMWKTLVQFLSWIDPLEKGKAIHTSILAWRIPWTV